MKNVTIEIYEYSDIIKPENSEVKQAVLNKLWDINVDYDWWQWTYEDAKERAGLIIKYFDIDRREISGMLDESLIHSANLIKNEHGETCETYNLAIHYLQEYDKIFEKYKDPKRPTHVHEDFERDFDNELDDLEKDYLNELLEEYLCILGREYDYLTSEEAILETIAANEYTFTENGEIY